MKKLMLLCMLSAAACGNIECFPLSDTYSVPPDAGAASCEEECAALDVFWAKDNPCFDKKQDLTRHCSFVTDDMGKAVECFVGHGRNGNI